jgi:hypothetical protein
MLDRRPPADDDVTDEEDNISIDPELRLRTVRTAASTLAESAAVEQRAERRKTLHLNKKKKGSIFRRGTGKKRPVPESVPPAGPIVPGQRRTIYVNRALPMSEVDSKNEPLVRYPRNKVRTTSELLSLSPASPPPRPSRVLQNIPSSRLYQRTCTSSFAGWRMSISWRWSSSKVGYLGSGLSENPATDELIPSQCSLCSARPPRKPQPSLSYLSSLSPLLRTGSKIIVAPRSTRKLILPLRLNWEIGRTSTVKRTLANGMKSCWVSTRRGRLQRVF